MRPIDQLNLLEFEKKEWSSLFKADDTKNKTSKISSSMILCYIQFRDILRIFYIFWQVKSSAERWVFTLSRFCADLSYNVTPGISQIDVVAIKNT